MDGFTKTLNMTTGANGEILDLNTLTSRGQTYTHYGTKGHHPFPQISSNCRPDFITKQKQDAYPTGNNCYGEKLQDKIEEFLKTLDNTVKL